MNCMITEHFVCFTTDFFNEDFDVWIQFSPSGAVVSEMFRGYSVILQNCPPSEGKAPCVRFYEKR